MIDIFNVQKGDIIVYGRYSSVDFINSLGPLTSERYFGIYQDFTFRSFDGEPIKLWIYLIGQDGAGKAIYPSQIVNVIRSVKC